MLRRDFLKTLPALPALAAIPGMRGGTKIKINDVRLLRTRVVRETGTIINWVGIPNAQRVGGTSFIEVHTDQGLIGLGPTVVFFAALSWVIARHRTAGPGGISGGGTVAKAIGAVFGVAGLANLVLVAVIGSVAWREHSLAIWLIYPCAVFILQGAAWLVSFTLRRRSWHALVALGWFAAAVGMAISIESLAWYILFAGLGLFLCIALPGAALLTLSRKAV